MLLETMSLPASPVAFYGLTFIGIVLVFHVLALPGQYWTKVEAISGTVVYWHSDLWKYCKDHYFYQRCERINNITGKLELSFCCSGNSLLRLSLF